MMPFTHYRCCKVCGHVFMLSVENSDLRETIDSAFTFKQKFAKHEAECNKKLVETITFGGRI